LTAIRTQAHTVYSANGSILNTTFPKLLTGYFLLLSIFVITMEWIPAMHITNQSNSCCFYELVLYNQGTFKHNQTICLVFLGTWITANTEPKISKFKFHCWWCSQLLLLLMPT